MARASLLRTKTSLFCQAFLHSNPPTETLNDFFTPCPQITEHGPAWARTRLPFLGQTFTGRRCSQSTTTDGTITCDDYFDLLSSTLSFHPDDNSFPPDGQFIVDAAAGAVSVVAHARFTSVATGKGWEEDFIYRLSGFDDEGRIGHWEIWADALSAWEAVGRGVGG